MTEATDRLTAALADRYRIEHMLGKGGMATVYLARDSRHDRDVAIKVLNGELTESLGRQRFLRETRDSSLCSESPPHGDTMARRSMQWTGGAALLLGTLMLGVLGARFAPHTSDVDDVWAMEDAYWRYVKAGDVEKYRTLWNDGFRGWPCHTEHPATKASIGDWVKEIHDGKITFEYKLTREGASNVNGVVVVFYWTPMIWKYADGRVDGRQDLPRKFTHTWMKVDGKWQIIGGMCGADAPRS